MELDPENIQGLHNLCVVHVERGKLLEAQTCLEKAHRLAPGEDYILRHLQIVQSRIAKLKLGSDENGSLEHDFDSKAHSKMLLNKSADESERKTKPVVSGDSEEQRYSSRVVNTEPLFVKNVENVDYSESYGSGMKAAFNERNVSKFGGNRRKLNGADNDDPSSGMS